MSTFAAALANLNLSQNDATELLARDGRPMKRSMVADMVAARTRIPPGVWERLSQLNTAIDEAADDIIADQGELDGGEGLTLHTVMVSTVPLPHPKLRAAAAARAMLVLGPLLLAAIDERERVA